MRADDGGSVTITRATYRRLLEERRIAEVRLHSELEHAEHVRKWAHEAFEEQRRLAERCTFLYGEAMKRGATRQDLMQGTWVVKP